MISAAKQHQYWNDLSHPSMPDQNLVDLEVKAIVKHLHKGSLLDVGCGEGENTQKFARVKNLKVTAVDFAENRIKLAKKIYPHIKFIHADITRLNNFNKFDHIVSQRFLINLPSWKQQKIAIKKLINYLNPKGKLILCEGSLQGVQSLNKLRGRFKLDPIPIRWHNVFIDDNNLIKIGFKLTDDFGGYFLLTRVARPYFEEVLNWNCFFNRTAKTVDIPIDCSRQKVWVYQNN